MDTVNIIENEENQKVVISGYSNLEKFSIKEQMDYTNPPKEMIELLKLYIPTHVCVGTIWSRSRPLELKETQNLRSDCNEYRKKILAFDFYGCITFILNDEVIVVRIYDDEYDECKKIEFLESHIFKYEYQFK